MFRQRLFVSACLLARARAGDYPDGPIDNKYELKFIDTAKHPLAVCNDGSPAAYYVHVGDCPMHSFVIHQQGGWWCWDDYSCKVRWEHFEDGQLRALKEKRHLMSTVQLQNTTTAFNTFNGEKNTGLMVTGNANVDPHFYRASKVFVAYCSSDSHAGNTTTRDATGRTWHFRGKEIIRAIIADLVEEYDLGKAERLVLTGGSAGGMATVANGDWVRTLLPPLQGRRYIAYPDAGVFQDVQPHRMCDSPDVYECKCAAGAGCGIVTLATQMQKMIMYTKGIPDESCTQALGRWGAWRCYLGQYAWPFLAETFLLNQMQTDEWQAFWNGFTGWANSSRPEEAEYAEWFKGDVQNTWAGILGSGSTNVYVFSPSCVIHTFTYGPEWWNIKVDGKSSRDIIGALANGEKVEQQYVDLCEGISCTEACKPSVLQPTDVIL